MSEYLGAKINRAKSGHSANSKNMRYNPHKKVPNNAINNSAHLQMKEISSSLKNMSNTEKYTLIQLMEVYSGKRPQIDKALVISQEVSALLKKYDSLSSLQKKAVSRNTSRQIVNSIFSSTDSRDGAEPYNKLLNVKCD